MKMSNKQKTPTYAGVEEGGIAASLGVLIAVAVSAVRSNNPDLPWDVGTDATVAAAATGVIVGLLKAIRKRRERKR
jgi:4-amino-4-deoxy-L-arabinose transferase-like glycosyltransferase